MDFKNIFLLVVVIFNFLLGFVVLSKNWRDKINRSYVAVCVSTGLWALALLFFRISGSILLALYWMKLAYIFALGIAVTFFYFTLLFPEARPLSAKERTLLLVPPSFLILFLLFPSFLTKSVIYEPGGKTIILGFWEYLVYALYFVFYFFLGGVVTAFRKYQHSKGILRAQLLFIAGGSFFSAIFGCFFNLILPSSILQNFNYIWLGPIFSLIMIGSVALAILKHHLMNIKVIATEMLTIGIILALIVQTIVAKTWQELVLRLVILVAVAIFGILLIRSVWGEVRRREEMEELAKKLEKATKQLAGANRELEAANYQLKELDQTKTDFISIASHQLRTPLTIIKGFVSMILEGDYGSIPEQIKSKLKDTFDANERLIKLVDDLLNISRIETGKFSFNFQKIQLLDLAQKAVEGFGLKAKEKGLAMEFIAPKKPLPLVQADPDKLYEVIANFLDNAIKYTEKGKIAVSIEQKKNEIVFSVQDTGVGLDRKELDSIFQKFSRGKESGVQHPGGLGLGLYVAKKIIDSHQGKIWAESAGKGKGSRFVFSLPA